MIISNSYYGQRILTRAHISLSVIPFFTFLKKYNFFFSFFEHIYSKSVHFPYDKHRSLRFHFDGAGKLLIVIVLQTKVKESALGYVSYQYVNTFRGDDVFSRAVERVEVVADVRGGALASLATPIGRKRERRC